MQTVMIRSSGFAQKLLAIFAGKHASLVSSGASEHVFGVVDGCPVTRIVQTTSLWQSWATTKAILAWDNTFHIRCHAIKDQRAEEPELDSRPDRCCVISNQNASPTFMNKSYFITALLLKFNILTHMHRVFCLGASRRSLMKTSSIAKWIFPGRELKDSQSNNQSKICRLIHLQEYTNPTGNFLHLSYS